MAAGGGLGSGGGNPVWSFLWFLGLFFIGWPVAGFCAGWYILILPFAVCIDPLNVSLNVSLSQRVQLHLVQGVCDILLKGVQCPHFCAKHMMEGTPLGDAFK